MQGWYTRMEQSSNETCNYGKCPSTYSLPFNAVTWQAHQKAKPTTILWHQSASTVSMWSFTSALTPGSSLARSTSSGLLYMKLMQHILNRSMIFSTTTTLPEAVGLSPSQLCPTHQTSWLLRRVNANEKVDWWQMMVTPELRAGVIASDHSKSLLTPHAIESRTN